jgi:hypothetical protein
LQHNIIIRNDRKLADETSVSVGLDCDAATLIPDQKFFKPDQVQVLPDESAMSKCRAHLSYRLSLTSE